MHKLFKLYLFLTFIGVAGALASAQSSPATAPIEHYKADFVVKEVDATGRVANSRNYSTILATNNQIRPNQIRSGDRVPVRVTTSEKGDFQYIDIGVNIDCSSIQAIDRRLSMAVKAEVTSVPAGTDLSAPGVPLIRQFQWNSDVVITPGIPTTIFSSDDISSKIKMQVEVTATLIK